MCGIFGQISTTKVNRKNIEKLVKHAEQRGKDSSGLIYLNNSSYVLSRADYDIEKLLFKVKPFQSQILFGHSRLITNGLSDNQPVVRGNICVVHNGIIVNEEEVWSKIRSNRRYIIDSELIVAIAEEHLQDENDLYDLPKRVLSLCKGIIACALVIPSRGKLILFSNNGSLYL